MLDIKDLKRGSIIKYNDKYKLRYLFLIKITKIQYETIYFKCFCPDRGVLDWCLNKSQLEHFIEKVV